MSRVELGGDRTSPDEPGRARRSPDDPGRAWTSPVEYICFKTSHLGVINTINIKQTFDSKQLKYCITQAALWTKVPLVLFQKFYLYERL